MLTKGIKKQVSRLNLNKVKILSKWIEKATGLFLTVYVNFISHKQDLFINTNCQDGISWFLDLGKAFIWQV